MLVLTRRLNQTVMIDDNIEVKVLAIKGKQVRLGIKAPRSISVDREEMRRIKEGGLEPPRLVVNGNLRLQ